MIRDADAEAYRGVIPADHAHPLYMSASELAEQLTAGVHFRCFVEDGSVEEGREVGMMGLENRGEVQLIRHTYVRTDHHRRVIGALLLAHLIAGMDTPPF